MPEAMQTQTASRSAWLELREELRLVNDGYEFLDEKRILLAAEMLRQRDQFRAAWKTFRELNDRAATALVEAAADQGLGGLQVFPPAELPEARLIRRERPYVGQIMLEAELVPGDPRPVVPAVRPTPQVRECVAVHREILLAAAALAAMAANLQRLMYEYQRTERRVRALENVVLPEIRTDLKRMEEHLDSVDQEEVLRVRLAGRDESSATADI